MQRFPSLIRALPFLVMLALSACGGGADSPAASTTDDPARVASVRLVDAAPLFTEAGQQQRLQAQALDAEGRVLTVPVQWTSSAPQRVSVGAGSDASAALTAGSEAGAAVLTATAGAHQARAVAVVVPAGPGVVTLTDAQIDGDPVAAPGVTTLRPGSTYTVTLAAGVTPPPVGTRVIGQGTKAVAGEVVAVAGQQLTLALVPLPQLLPALTLDIDLPLQAAAPRPTAQAGRARIQSDPRERTQAETSFSIAGFECEAEGSAGGVTLAKKTVTPTGLDSLRYRVLWNSQQKLMRLSGQPGVQFELEPTASLTFSGKLDCQLELVDIPIPIPPALSLFLGVGFPVGVGFTLDGELPVNSVALNLTGQAQADVVVGFDCQADCASLNRLTTSGAVTPTLIAPDFTANRLALNGQVYAWANFEGGARWSSTLQFDAIEAQAGLKFATVFGTENAQARDAASAGQYALTLEASAGPTEALGDFASLVGLLLDQARFETSVPLGRSPTATLAASATRFLAGDAVQFQVDLNADEVLFPLQGYNVQAVRVYRKTVADDGSFVLVLANEVAASNGQTQFILPWVATVDSAANISFVAFVKTRLLNGLRWQVGLVQAEAQPPAQRFGQVSGGPGGAYDIGECVRDELTGRIWSGSVYSGPRNVATYYTNLIDNGQPQVYAGSDGTQALYRAPTPEEVASPGNSQGFLATINREGLCGFSDWRLPTRAEVELLYTAPADQFRQWIGLPPDTNTWVSDSGVEPRLGFYFNTAGAFVAMDRSARFANVRLIR